MKRITLTCIYLCFLTAISGTVIARDAIVYAIPDEINISKQEISHALQKQGLTLDKDITLKISVFYFSEHIERLSLSDDHKLSTRYKDGFMHALVKIKKNGILIKALFIKGEGRDKEAILNNFALNLKKKLG